MDDKEPKARHNLGPEGSPNDIDDSDVEFRESGTVHLPEHLSVLATPIASGRAERAKYSSRSEQEIETDGARVTSGSILTHPIALVAAFLLIVVIISLGVDVSLLPMKRLLNPHPVVSLDIGMFAEAIAALAALAIMTRLAERRSLASIGFDRRGAARQIGRGLAIGAFIGIATMWALVASQDYVMSGPHARFGAWLPLGLCLAYAVADETIFRGYVFRVIEYRYGSLIALVAMAFISAALHVADSVPIPLSLSHRIYGETIVAISTGLLLAASYMATRRLWTPMAIQWAWSFVAGPIFGMNLNAIGIDTSSWCHPLIFGGVLRSGGALGPAASVPSALIWLVAGIFMLWHAIRAGQWKQFGAWQPAVLPTAGEAEPPR